MNGANGATDIELQRWSRALRGTPVLWLSVGVVALVALLLWLRGAGFYPLPLAERVEHEDYEALSPSRRTGMSYGLVGTLLMLLNLSYLLRRRFPHWPLGRMRLWLDVHVLTGIVAALFVAFHSAFQLRSLVSTVTAATLGITVLTGLVGRFFYAFAPRLDDALSGRIKDLERLVPGVKEPLAEAIAKEVAPSLAGTGLMRVLASLPQFFRAARARQMWVMAVFRLRAAHVDALERENAAPLAREVSRLAAREVYAAAARELLRTWRPWHRLCAFIMVAGVFLHAGVALFYGYGWRLAW